MSKIKYIDKIDRDKLIEFLNKNKIEVSAEDLEHSTLSKDENYILILSNGTMIALSDFECQIFKGEQEITNLHLGIEKKYRKFIFENFKDNPSFSTDLTIFFDNARNSLVEKKSTEAKKHGMKMRRIKEFGESLKDVHAENERHTYANKKIAMMLRRLNDEEKELLSTNLESQPQ